MKKSFIKVTLLCALLLSAPLSFVSCTDYGKDIERIDTKDKELTSQLEALEKALTLSKAEIEAAKASAAGALKEAQAAKAVGDAAALAAAQASAQAELAKQAAAQAKADAIAYTTAEVKKLMEITATKEELKALAARIDGIEKGLNTLSADVSDVKSQLVKFNQALEIQTAALEQYKTLVGTQLTGIVSDVNKIKSDIDTVISDLAKVKAEMATKTELNTTKVDLERQIKEASDKVMEVLGSRIDTLIGTLISRLTSITLIPSVFVEGIPAIDFRSAEYTPKKFENGKIIDISGRKNIVVSNGKTVAKYRLNPMGIAAADIVSEGDNRPAFMEDIAEARSAVRQIIDIESFDVKDGVMTVYAKKAKGFTDPYTLTDKKINIVSLRLTNKNLFEGETAKDATVYSEYVRLAETTFTPVIAAAPFTEDVVNHYSDSTTLYTSAIDKNIDAQVNYNKSIDLKELATGCYVVGGKHINITAEELKSYGLEFKFALGAKAYNLNGVNQQIYAKLDANGFLTSQVPAGETNQEIGVDKQPIIRVALVDVKNGNLVDQRYIKVKFTKDLQPSVDLGVITTWEQVLGCGPFTYKLAIEKMQELVYNKLNGGKGMSKEDFAKHYTLFSYEGVADNVTNNTIDPKNSTPIVWTLQDEDINKIVPEVSKTFEVLVKFSDPRKIYGDVTFKLALVVNVVEAKVNGYNEGYWRPGSIGTVLRITPIHLTDPNRTSAVCEYNSNIWNAFTLYNGTLVKGLGICSAWDMQFAVNGQLAGFKPANTTEPSMLATGVGYKLIKDGNTAPAATLNWEAGHTAWAGVPTNTYTKIYLNKNNGGKDLVGKNIKVGIWANINSYNTHNVTKFDLEIVRPLVINATLTNAVFYDHVYGGSKISCAEAFTMTDFAKYTVAKVSKIQYAEELYKYYEIQDPSWDITNAKVGMKMVGGNLTIDDSLTASNSISLNSTVYANSVSKDADNLIFNNNSGLNVETPFNIFIKTKVNYGWGTAEEWVTVRVKPSKDARR